jgi:tetratricopeptide (TPR) repeat protein
MRRTGKAELLQPSIGFYFYKQAAGEGRAPDRIARAQLTFRQGKRIISWSARSNCQSTCKPWRDAASALPGQRSSRFRHDAKWRQKVAHPHQALGLQLAGRIPLRQTRLLAKRIHLRCAMSGDNSAENLRNPNHPPRRVTFGPQSTDEMGELWLQVLPGTTNDWVRLDRKNMLMISRETAAFYENFLRAHPDDAPSHLELGKVLGPLGQTAAAAQHLQTALRLDPNRSEAHYLLGIIFFNEEQYSQARAEFESELRLNPNHSKAHVRLGLISIEEQNLDEAAAHLRTAVRINPKDAMAQEILARIVKAQAESKPYEYARLDFIPMMMLCAGWLANGCSRQQASQATQLTNAPVVFPGPEPVHEDTCFPRR